MSDLEYKKRLEFTGELIRGEIHGEGLVLKDIKSSGVSPPFLRTLTHNQLGTVIEELTEIRKVMQEGGELNEPQKNQT